MKVAYLVLHLEENYFNGGVGQKITRQIKNWQKFGVDAELFILTSDPIQTDLGSVFHFSKTKNNFLFREYKRSRALSRLIKSLSVYQPDLIYLRFATYAFPLHQIYEIAPVVVEVNTIDIHENKLRSKFVHIINLFTRGIILKNASGLAATSHEIAAHNSFRKFNIPVAVISNGVDIVEKNAIPPTNNQNPRMVFLGSPNQSWQGVDKLVWLAHKLPEINFDVVGLTSIDIGSKPIPANMKFHGYLSSHEYLSTLRRSDVGLGTLGLHRKNMNEASPLKVREYLAHGILTILPYEDTDIISDDYDFILELPNTEDNLRNNWEVILDFAHFAKGRRFDPTILVNEIDSGKKEGKRIDFFKQFLE